MLVCVVYCGDGRKAAAAQSDEVQGIEQPFLGVQLHLLDRVVASLPPSTRKSEDRSWLLIDFRYASAS